MNTQLEVKIAVGGHLITWESVCVSPYIALQLVEKDAYCYAEKSDAGETITLYKKILECPICTTIFSSTEFSLTTTFAEWALQYSFPEWDVEKKQYILQPEYYNTTSAKCPRCGSEKVMTSHFTSFRITSTPTKTIVSQTIPPAKSAQRVNPPTKTMKQSISMSIIFNHRTHRTTYIVCDKNHTILQRKNLDYCPQSIYTIPIINIFAISKKLRQALVDSFVAKGIPVSIPDAYLTIDHLIYCNRFQGFPECFYNALPLNYKTNQIDSDFVATANTLSNYDILPSKYSELALPSIKSLRKSMFENPGLFFYTKEIQLLPFHNRDILLQILQSKLVFRFLSLLKSYPGSLFFIKALIKEKGEPRTWRRIQKDLLQFIEDASLFAILPVSKKQSMIQINAHKTTGYTPFNTTERNFNHPQYSLPILVASSLHDCVIGNYHFIYLKNSLEYHRIAASLHNCLADATDSSIIGIKKGGQYIAAIEVEGNAITQAKTEYNFPISRDADLFPIFLQWAEQCHLTHPPITPNDPAY